ncbi:ABC transporter permease [Asticcacaulis benevestitus]|uniref:ABC3 transporter permease protein domain-containing protein n=1 Tax=Asticcacaulis benevestitus DSM 16100 = ATCC BAA-896 TaxID=1121022 RepID=V4PLJ9_9CAUL|nr:ABC transporter permease [Asticcacaulis benevestitus]ESQ88124.1 hypothetical protein ABENE_16475 [Asticcacaulis benevestitus DSM 16100 = ATCC BAA-896]
MFRTYLAAALRHLAYNRLYAAINIAGLALGFATVILIALYVRNELSFDSGLPGADHTYLAVARASGPRGEPIGFASTPPALAAQLLARSNIDAVARMAEDQGIVSHDGKPSRHVENFAYADPDIASVIPWPALYGVFDGALDAPDSAVITRKIALAYFGKENPIGETIEISPLSDPRGTHSLRIMAVLKDLPAETTWTAEILVSGRAAFSTFNYRPAWPCSTCIGGGNTHTYVRLRPGTNIESASLDLVPITKLHQRPDIRGMENPPVEPSMIIALCGVGGLVMLIAAINFITLFTARMTRRLVEVGVRKVAGARQGDLILQFVGENLLHITIGLIIGVAVVEQLIGPMNALLNRNIGFNWIRDIELIGLILLIWLVTGALAATYPALILSGFRPAQVLRTAPMVGRAGERGRQVVVVVQFALLITLMICSAVIYRQTGYAKDAGTRLNMDGVLIAWTCNPALRNEIVRIPGVEATTCSSWNALGQTEMANRKRQGPLALQADYVDYGFFELYGVKPLAGRLFDRTLPKDKGAWDNDPPTDDAAAYQLRHVILNAAAVKASGFPSPVAAIEKTVTVTEGNTRHSVQVIGVVPDFSVESVRQSVPAAAFGIMPYPMELMSIKLRPDRRRQTRSVIEAVWTRLGNQPKSIYSLKGYVAREFSDMQNLSAFVACCAGAALMVACLGLFGLSAVAAEQRTREIGIRKAMGAGRSDIVEWLVRRYMVPVVAANLLAWPIAYMLMGQWLSGFASHVDMELWIFAASSACALAIAWLTVCLHALIIAAGKPAKALRYE